MSIRAQHCGIGQRSPGRFTNSKVNHETEKITRKASDVAENLQLYRVVRFFHPRSSCTTPSMLFSERPPIVHDLLTYLLACLLTTILGE